MAIPESFFDHLAGLRFSSGPELTQFFRTRLGQDFAPWFNRNIAKQHTWRDRAIPPRGVARFPALWDAFLALRTCTLLEVLAYTGVFIQETGGTFLPKCEAFGNARRPGIAYLFDNFLISDSSGHSFQKASYNTGRANRTAGSLFRDPLYNRAHKHRPLGDKLAGTDNPIWDGEDYPDEVFPCSGQPEETGYILEADFFKFRGRGFIQTTWRENYLGLVRFVQAYTGKQAVMLRYREAWAGLPPDEVCTTSSNADWDALFQQSDLVLPCAAVLLHAQGSRYLPLALDAATANGTGPGSVARMGQRINGSLGYGRLLCERVGQMAAQMG